jgi:hypothetical protein
MDALAQCRLLGFCVARIDMARDAQTRIVSQYSIKSLRRFVSAIGN